MPLGVQNHAVRVQLLIPPATQEHTGASVIVRVRDFPLSVLHVSDTAMRRVKDKDIETQRYGNYSGLTVGNPFPVVVEPPALLRSERPDCRSPRVIVDVQTSPGANGGARDPAVGGIRNSQRKTISIASILYYTKTQCRL